MASKLQAALETVAELYAHVGFLDGDCHTLAVALYMAMGESGKLLACLRETLEEDGTVYATGYSHMVYVIDGESWDIDGPAAVSRWEDSFEGLGQPDKWGMTDRLRWEEVAYSEWQPWLQEHYGAIDLKLTLEVAATLRDTLASWTEPAQKRQVPALGY